MPFEKHLPLPAGLPAPLPAGLIAADADMDAANRPPQLPASLPLKSACRIVRQMVSELVLMFGDRVMLRRDRRRLACHVRQIAMYVCHVSLRISLSDIGEALGRDRTTVGHACHVVEDRRDDAGFDDFVSAIERMVTVVFGLCEVPAHD